MGTVEVAKYLPPSVFTCDAKDCSTYKDQSTCDKYVDCTWCKHAAVPSAAPTALAAPAAACNTVEVAKYLPPSVFTCDAKDVDVKDCSTYKDQSTCDKDVDCTWCKSAAVPSACNTVEDAKNLPPSVFTCDAKDVNTNDEE